MLVSSSMEHIVRTEGLEKTLYMTRVANACNHCFRRNIRELLCHHQADIVLRSLSLVDKHQGRRIKHGHLAHNLRTNGTGRTGNQYLLTSKQLAYRSHVYTNLRTWQQLFDRYLTHLQIGIIGRSAFFCF